MRNGKGLMVFLLFAVIAVFVYGVTELLILRFQRGDTYPPYSSFRPDPLGTKAFYEGLQLVKGVETVRNIEPLHRASGLSGTTLFLFGLRRTQFSAMPQSSVKAIEAAANEGGRIVISFVPVNDTSCPDPKEQKPRERSRKNDKEQKDEESGLLENETLDLAERWKLVIGVSAERETEASLSTPGQELPSSLAWHSTLFFEPRDEAWKTLYARVGKPVLIERSYGKGTLVLSSDSFIVSNEAMKSRRYPKLLSWLCGTHQRVVFDETHLGVSRQPGVATLLRKYGLGPFFLSLVILALLALWKQSARFVPAFEKSGESEADAGKDTFTGLANLMRRNIAPDDLLAACLEEWKRSFTHGKGNRSTLLPRIQEIIAKDRSRPRKSRNPVRTYCEISALETRQSIRRRLDRHVGSTQ